MPELLAAIQGRDVFFATHGFEVNQADGISHLGFWLDNLEIGNAVPIGIVWPGDCVIPIFVDYILEGREAIKSGQLLATFLNANFPVRLPSHLLPTRSAPGSCCKRLLVWLVAFMSGASC